MSRSPASDRPLPIVDVFDLARTGGTVSGELAVATLPRLAESLAAPGGALRYEFAGSMERLPDGARRPAAQLRLAAEVVLTCDRCGQALSWTLAAEPQYYFVHTEDELARIPVDDSDQEPLVGSARFDLAALAEDEALLALPMAPRHADCTAAQAQPTVPDAPAAESSGRPHPFAGLARLKSRRS